MGAYVNESGLRILAGSNNAISFTRDVTHAYRIKVVDDDGSLEAIKTAINNRSSANVEIFLNVDTAEYDLDNSGNTLFKPLPAMSEQVQSILNKINNEHFAKGISIAAIDENRPSIRANIDQNAFYALIEREDVRAIRPVGYSDSRAAQWPEEVLEAAKEHGEAEIAITLRGGGFSSAKTGYMSSAAIKTQANANQRAFDAILSRIGVSDSSENTSTNSEIGIFHIKLSFEALAKLYDNADARILSIELNKPAAWTTLMNSTALLNMSTAWNAGYRAAGQSIIVIDSGIRKNHAFFTTGGVSRVNLEACFGSNVTDPKTGIAYSTICPSPDASGDSPLNFPNSGEPYSNLTVCNTLASLDHNCGHGTHVAGIAAGRKSTSITPTNLQGVGPDASIISAQVFSYNNTVPKATAFILDVQKALQTVYDNTIPGVNNPLTVNMSIGGEHYPATAGACDSYSSAIKNLIVNLTSRGIPVVIAAGNNGSRTDISWPACVSQAIKVSSVFNDANGTSLSEFANIGNPASFVGPILLAPGGSNTTTVLSANRTSTTATLALRGTSQASPHVAGIYAAVKAANPSGVTVADVTAWIVSTGSIPVAYNLPFPVGFQTYRRVRIPNL